MNSRHVSGRCRQRLRASALRCGSLGRKPPPRRTGRGGRAPRLSLRLDQRQVGDQAMQQEDKLVHFGRGKARQQAGLALERDRKNILIRRPAFLRQRDFDARGRWRAGTEQAGGAFSCARLRLTAALSRPMACESWAPVDRRSLASWNMMRHSITPRSKLLPVLLGCAAGQLVVQARHDRADAAAEFERNGRGVLQALFAYSASSPRGGRLAGCGRKATGLHPLNPLIYAPVPGGSIPATRNRLSGSRECPMAEQRRTVLITGAADGIGWAMAQRFAGGGDRIAIADLRLDAAKERAAELGQEPSRRGGGCFRRAGCVSHGRGGVAAVRPARRADQQCRASATPSCRRQSRP